jgi:hypothetical protein
LGQLVIPEKQQLSAMSAKPHQAAIIIITELTLRKEKKGASLKLI